MQSRNSPSLPFSLLDLIDRAEELPLTKDALVPGTKTAGPIPKSWIPTHHIDRNTQSWRSTALSIVHISDSKSSIASLTQLCLCFLLHSFPDPAEFAAELVPWLPPHLRRELLRYTAIDEPLANAKLYPLFDPAGHADGEIIVIGPQASLRNDLLPSYRYKKQPPSTPLVGTSAWDADDVVETTDEGTRLHSLALVSVSISMQSYLNFPPSLTHLALVDLSTSVPLHRLPGLCPSLVILDLSFNKWLGSAKTSDDTALGRIDWQKWSVLQILGLRSCLVDLDFLEKVNRGRWADIKIIQ
jgi:hypothetical protein